MSGWMVGVDTGGTFTDLIAVEAATGEFRLAKVPSVPDDPSAAVANALDELFAGGIAPAEITSFVHGTTVATNALLEAKGARAGLLITRGFRAVYEARGWSQPNGTDLIDPHYRKPPLLIPQWLTEEVTERVDHRGGVATPIDEADLRRAVRSLKQKRVDGVAVCFLFSFLNPEHERRVAAVIAQEAPEWRVSLSSNVLPVIREYPRLSTTVIDAYVGPCVERYLLRLADRLRAKGIETRQSFLMQSNGGLMRLELGARFPNQTLLSGPAAGVVAATEVGRVTGESNVVTFDMGGTSTDIAVIVGGRVLETSEGRIAGQDIGSPMLKVRTLGAGGGTVAWIGKDGLLKVGPQSAGAIPGPACYGRGGELPTVTDANIVLGALGGETPIAGTFLLDEARARRAVQQHVAEPLGLDVVAAAAGIVRIVNTNMAIDLRLALQEEGQDPRRFALIAFGGAGPIHATQVASDIGIPRVLVPPHPGINCATGLLQTSVKHSYLRSAGGGLRAFSIERMNCLFAEIEAAALDEVDAEGFDRRAAVLTRRLDLRYLQQGYQLTVDCPPGALTEAHKNDLKRAFDRLHHDVYGQSAQDEDIEIVTFRVQSEVDVDRFAFARRAGSGTPLARARTGERPLFDIKRKAYVAATVYAREKLAPGDMFEGPAIINQFDATTVLLADQRLSVDPFGILVIDL